MPVFVVNLIAAGNAVGAGNQHLDDRVFLIGSGRHGRIGLRVFTAQEESQAQGPKPASPFTYGCGTHEK